MWQCISNCFTGTNWWRWFIFNSCFCPMKEGQTAHQGEKNQDLSFETRLIMQSGSSQVYPRVQNHQIRPLQWDSSKVKAESLVSVLGSRCAYLEGWQSEHCCAINTVLVEIRTHAPCFHAINESTAANFLLFTGVCLVSISKCIKFLSIAWVGHNLNDISVILNAIIVKNIAYSLLNFHLKDASLIHLNE